MFHLRPGPESRHNSSFTHSSRTYSDVPVSPLGSDFDISDARRNNGVDQSTSIKRKDLPSATITEQATANQPNRGIEMESLMQSGEDYPRELESEKLVRWGVTWWKEPTYMVLFAILGLGLAVGHHGYYSSLHGSLAGSNSKQQWAHNFGNMFAISVVAVLHAANGLAYTQYFWRVVRGKSFTVEALDKLFSLTSDPLGFFNWEVARRAPLAFLLALTCWIMALAGVLPPGTLTVVPGTLAFNSIESLPTLNWSGPGWVPGGVSDYTLDYGLWTKPTPLIIGLASQVAQSMDILPFFVLAPNSSFSMEVTGPYLQCGAPNSTQQAVFDYYQNKLSNVSILTASTFKVANNSYSREYMSIFSAFVPWLGRNGWTSHSKQILDMNPSVVAPDIYNNWDVAIPPDYSIGYQVNSTQFLGRRRRQVSEDESSLTKITTRTTARTASRLSSASEETDSTITLTRTSTRTATSAGTSATVTSISKTSPGISTQILSYQIAPQQMFVQTVDNSIICTLGNGTRDVHFNFTNSVQNVWYGPLRDFNPLFVPQSGSIGTNDTPAFDVHTYMAVFVSLTNMLSGNVTTAFEYVDQSVQMLDQSSRVLLTGLSACDEFTNNTFTKAPVWADFSGTGDGGIEVYNDTFTNDLFGKPAWMCRNRTLARAIEDLATNITISMMSQSQLTTPNSTKVTISHYPTRNVYRYDALYLILSYGIALLFTTLGISLGMFSFHRNGVIHSTSFSAIVATTRNRDLDGLSQGHSLGTVPVDKRLRRTRLRFGILVGG
ncbi:hypothetical protein IFR05_011306, partial [Cadophora sp. M221]